MECWASQLGGCEGPQSGEHYVTRALFSGPIVVKGARWIKSKGAIPLSSAKANILCKRHNERLSDADVAAVNVQKVSMYASRPPRFGQDGRMRRRPKRFHIDGKLFSRWLTKTYCNLMTLDKRTPDCDYVAHSFDEPTRRELRVYTVWSRGERLHSDPEHVRVTDYSDEAGNTIWVGRLVGFTWVVSTAQLEEFGSDLRLPGVAEKPSQLMHRPQELAIRAHRSRRSRVDVCPRIRLVVGPPAPSPWADL